MGSDSPRRGFFRTYTPRNIRNEVKLRLAALARRRRRGERSETRYDDRHARAVGRFYDEHHDQFLEIYGEVIQAFRTRDVADLLDHQARALRLEPGQRLLDAGCGNAAPAIHFARAAPVRIDAITISRAQAERARERVAAAGLSERISVVEGDFHRLPDHFPAGSYDVVYFLESFGHSRDKAHLVGVCWQMLAPGGTLYVKDLFRRVPARPEHRRRIDREIRKINRAYRYDVGDLNAVLDDLRRTGFILARLETVDLELDEFEDLAISNEFQELTGLALIEDWEEYVFPVDFFALTCVKPELDPDHRPDRHFLQNRLHARSGDGREAS